MTHNPVCPKCGFLLGQEDAVKEGPFWYHNDCRSGAKLVTNKTPGGTTLSQVIGELYSYNQNLINHYNKDFTLDTAIKVILEQDRRIELLRNGAQFASDNLIEINPNNYNHDDVCVLNNKSVESALALDEALAATSPDAEWEV